MSVFVNLRNAGNLKNWPSACLFVEVRAVLAEAVSYEQGTPVQELRLRLYPSSRASPTLTPLTVAPIRLSLRLSSP